MDKFILEKDKLFEICKNEDIQYLGVFGSFARGESNKKSDIDLLVRFSKRKSLLNLVRIEREITTLLGKPVDLVTEAALSPYIRDRVKQELQVLYEEKAR